MPETVLILGASDNPERYAYKAFHSLRAAGHTVIPVNPRLAAIEGVACLPDLAAVTGPVDTVTLYVRPEIVRPMTAALVALKPRRVIFNPGTEDVEIETQLQKSGIATLRACTLVLLKTKQF
jgi:hypothetical protein